MNMHLMTKDIYILITLSTTIDIYIYALLPLSFYECWSLNRRIFAGFIQTGFFWYFSLNFLKIKGFFPWFFFLKTPNYPLTTPQKTIPSPGFSICNLTNYIKLKYARVHWKKISQKKQHKKCHCCEQKNNKKWKQKIYCNYLAIWKTLWRFTASIIAVVYLGPHTTSKLVLFVALTTFRC